MSEEIKLEENRCDESKCILKSKCFKNFAVISLGSFVGVFCALSLFSALHKPPMMPPMCPHMMKHHAFHHHMHHKMMKGEHAKKFHKEFKKEFKKEFEKQKPIQNDED